MMRRLIFVFFVVMKAAFSQEDDFEALRKAVERLLANAATCESIVQDREIGRYFLVRPAKAPRYRLVVNEIPIPTRAEIRRRDELYRSAMAGLASDPSRSLDKLELLSKKMRVPAYTWGRIGLFLTFVEPTEEVRETDADFLAAKEVFHRIEGLLKPYREWPPSP